MTFLALNEFTVWRLLWLRAFGKPVYVLFEEPLMNFSNRLLQPLYRLLRRKNIICNAVEMLPGLSYFIHFPVPWALSPIYEKVEAEADVYFRFAEMDEQIGSYSLAYKHSIANGIKSTLDRVLHLRAAEDEASKNLPGGLNALRVVGLDADTVFLYRAFYGEYPRVHYEVMRGPRIVFNALTALIIAAVGIYWIFRRLRLRLPRSKRYKMGLDFVVPGRHVDMILDIVDQPEDVLVVFRNNEMAAENCKNLDGLDSVRIGDGIVDPQGAVNAISVLVKDLFVLGRNLGGLHPTRFYDIAKQVYKRILMRGLFNRYKFENFFGRDDYNTEHIIRTQELHRIGAISMGIAHGLPTFIVICPHWRYIGFDYYYVFGEHPFKDRYADTWPESVTVRAVGSWGMSRSDFVRQNISKPKDFIFFSHPLTDPVETLDVVFEVARAFPNRRFYVKYKRSTLDGEQGPSNPIHAKYAERFDQDRPDNLVLTNELPYDLFQKASYVIAGVTTAVAEGIEFGLPGFVVDVYDDDLPMIYREYPDICVTSPSSVIDAVHDYESGQTKFDKQKYRTLIGMPDQHPFDIIRSDMGLAPKDQRALAC